MNEEHKRRDARRPAPCAEMKPNFRVLRRNLVTPNCVFSGMVNIYLRSSKNLPKKVLDRSYP